MEVKPAIAPAVHKVRQEDEGILDFYKNLFTYKAVYIFPQIKKQTVEPLLNIGRDENLVFFRAREIDWLNFYHDVLFKSKEKKSPTTIDDFFDHYELNVLFPIRYENQCYGFLGISNYNRPVNNLELKIGMLITRYLSSIWHNQELLQDVERSSDQIQHLFSEISTVLEVGQAIESGGNIQNLLELIMSKCMEVMHVEAVSLMLLTDDGKELEFRIALGPKGKEVKPYHVKLGKGIAGVVAKTGKPLIIPDAYTDKRFDPSFDKRTGFKTRSVLCVPLTYQDKTIGVVQALNRFDGKIFTEHDLRTFSIFASQAAIAIQNSKLFYQALEKEKLDTEINVASEIQHLIVPEKLPRIKNFDISAHYIPYQGVGGDFYAVLPVNDQETVFCIADVSGKSVPGALLVSTLHATLKAYLEFTSDLKWIIERLNQLIIQLSTTDRFITLFLACYNHDTKELSYISAGHNPQLILRYPFDLIPLKSTGICIGLIPFDYKIQTLKLHNDDVLILYTDGIVEALNEKRETYGEERLRKILFDMNNQNASAKFIARQILNNIKDFTGKTKADDDLTLLIVKKVK